jgi:citrate lyase beta subunit
VILRSVLFAPANHARHAEKALTGPNDGVILDLEDAVSVGQKPRARMAARDLVQNRIEGGPVVFVRINALNTPSPMMTCGRSWCSASMGSCSPR